VRSGDAHLQSLPTYRPDIDGLRALAVASVILFHARVPGTGGGYVGVDVFFVISGYLITQVLASADATRLRVSLREFYLRRGRRILPALYVAVLLVAVAVVIIYLPWDLDRFGKYLVAAPLFASNIPAWIEGADYFGMRADYVVLTHLWSIAVEEQFYFLYPVTLLLIGRFLPRYRSAALTAVALLSLILCVWASYHRPIGNFFLAPSRAWELLLGALLALRPALRIRQRLANEVLAVAALVTLGFAVASYGPLTRYPGLYTIAPCAAAALLIVTAREQATLASRLLSLRPVVFTGLISYSLYLWHLPLLAIGRYYNIRPLGAVRLGALLAGLYLLAACTWKLIEKPVRYRSVLRSDRSFVLSAVACGAVICAFGLVLWHTQWVQEAFPSKAHAPDMNWLANTGSVQKCVTQPMPDMAAGKLCSYGPQDDTAPKAVVWGDSHAMALLPAYDRVANELRVRTYFAVRPACRPFPGVINRTDPEGRQKACLAFNAAALSAIRRLDPSLVILNSHWIDADTDLVLPAGLTPEPGESHFRRALAQTLRDLEAPARRKVCVVLDVPIYEYNVPYALGMAAKRGIPADFLTVSKAEARQQYSAPERDIRALQARGMLTTVDLKEPLCRGHSCVYQINGDPLYADENHLSVKGALLVSGTLAGCLRGLSTLERR
jgi:peptidoglycan/LPS O-acetylase OafA/YrhL